MSMATSNKTLLISGVAALVIVGGGAIWYMGQTSESAPSAPAEASAAADDDHHGETEDGGVHLTTAQIKAAGITLVSPSGGGGSEIRLAGRVEPMVDARASVAASVSGRIERLLVVPGQSVRAGQPLVAIVSGEAASFRAEVDAAGAEADAARLAYERTRNLFDQGVVARQEVEASRAQYLSAEAMTRAARARSSAAGSPNASGRISITSPIAGVVTNVMVGPGGFVNQGGVVAEVTNPARVELVFSAPAVQISDVRMGTEIRVIGPNGEFDATVTGISTGASDGTGLGTGSGTSGAATIRARPSGGSLPPAGSAVSGAIVSGQGSGVLTVPSEAVQTVDGQTIVFVASEKGFDVVKVLAGRQAGGRTEILRGLTGTEHIASTNAFLLKAEMAKGEAEHAH